MEWNQKVKVFLPPIMIDKLCTIKNIVELIPYQQLVKKNKQLQNVHYGRRCFILGSGPSIKKQDLTQLKDEIVFALNNFYVHPDFQLIMSGDQPKYYLIAPIHPPQSEVEWKAWFEDIQLHVPTKSILFFGLSSFQGNSKYIIDKYNLFAEHIIYWYIVGKSTEKYYSFNSKDIDLTKRVWNANAVSIYALLIAIYMGFSKIYLLGMDHDYFLYDNEEQMRMYKSAIHQKNELYRTFGDSFYVQEFLRQYHIFKQYELLDKNYPNTIYNASEGGILKVFKRISLENVLEGKN